MRITERNSKGFTLIELLVVIAIIAILASLLVPALARAKYSGMRSTCINNIRQQYLSQLMYANDYAGRFPDRSWGVSPDYHRTPVTAGRSMVDLLRGTYVQNTQIILCPIISKDWLPAENSSTSTTYSSGGYGGWDTDAVYVPTPYMWLANFKMPTYHDGEPEWPMNASELESRRAFITHRVSSTPGRALWDLGHLGTHFSGTADKPLWAFSVTPDQPVGQADGSVVIRPKSQIKARATGADSGMTTYYY